MAKSSFILSTSLLRRIVPPPLPPYPTGYRVPVDEYKGTGLQAGTLVDTTQVFPLRMKLASDSGDYWLLPIEPMVSLSGANTIIRRNVAKMGEAATARGTVKERWNQDDYRITISGMLRNFDNPNEYPKDDVNKLKLLCEARETIKVLCPLLEAFGIEQLVIENFDLPFTVGEDMQAYSITAYSDAIFELFIATESDT